MNQRLPGLIPTLARELSVAVPSGVVPPLGETAVEDPATDLPLGEDIGKARRR